MKEIKWICEQIDEELSDAEKYAKAAHHYKESDRELGRLCATLVAEELGHADRLHNEAKRIIKAHEADPPAAMLAVWQWEHEKMIDRTAKVQHTIALFNA